MAAVVLVYEWSCSGTGFAACKVFGLIQVQVLVCLVHGSSRKLFLIFCSRRWCELQDTCIVCYVTDVFMWCCRVWCCVLQDCGSMCMLQDHIGKALLHGLARLLTCIVDLHCRLQICATELL